jgi:hypothetical protein
MCDSLKQYTDIRGIVKDVKLNDHLLLICEKIQESPIKALVTEVYIKYQKRKLKIQLDNEEIARKVVFSIYLLDQDYTKPPWIALTSDIHIKDNLKITINKRGVLRMRYKNDTVSFIFKSTLKYIKCLNEISTKNITDLLELLPQDYTEGDYIGNAVFDYLQDDKKSEYVIKDTLLSYGIDNVHILPSIIVEPDYIEHTNDLEIFNDIYPNNKLYDVWGSLIEPFYYKMISNNKNLPFLRGLRKAIRVKYKEYQDVNKYISNDIESLNKFSTGELELDKNDEYYNLFKKSEKIPIKNRASYLSKKTIPNVYKRKKEIEIYFDTIDKQIKLNTENLKPVKNSILDKNVSLLYDSIYIQPIYRYYLLKDSKEIGHVVNILIDPKNKISYYLDSSEQSTTSFKTVNRYTDKTVLVTEKYFLDNIKEILNKRHNIEKLLNISELTTFCPTIEEFSSVGVQLISKDLRCQTWHLYYAIMFILNPTIPKGIISKVIITDYKKRLVQFSRYIYDKYIYRETFYDRLVRYSTFLSEIRKKFVGF